MSLLEVQAGIGKIPAVAARYVITGELVLDSAAHFGGGGKAGVVDMPLLRDPADGRFYLPGSGLAGVLRSHACDRVWGYNVPETLDGGHTVNALFGGHRGDENGEPSALAVFDCWATPTPPVAEIRDGVAIDPLTGTAAEHKKYDLEVLPRGTRFKLHLELVIPRAELETKRLSSLAAILDDLERGEIALGSRRTRGLGRCHVENWRAQRFDLSSRAGWEAWLGVTPALGGPALTVPSEQHIATALNKFLPQVGPGGAVSADTLQDKRSLMRLKLRLNFRSGVLVRSKGNTPKAADATHLFSGGVPVLPGTSVAGALRSRALRIAHLVRGEQGDAETWVNEVFGSPADLDAEQASQLWVAENVITHGTIITVNRVKIDRFTGGTVDHALFEEEPLYGGQAELAIELRCPAREDETSLKAKRGLILLVVKDLILGDLNLGGTGAVGRGFVEGDVEVHWSGLATSYRFGAQEAHTSPAMVATLNDLVTAFATAPVKRRSKEDGAR